MEEEKASPLKNLLDDIIASLGKKDRFTEEMVAKAWEVAVGAKAASHTKPRSYRNGRLAVNVDDSSWLYELTIRKKEILKKLESELKSKRIKDIMLRIGEVR